MKKRIKTKWLKALRSGDYKQGKYVLGDEERGFCCLGVLADIYTKETGERLNMTADLFNENVGQWAGMEKNKDTPGFEGKYNPFVTVAGKEICLSELNDDEGKSFKQIANIIEKHL